jgi:hypothetical protein
MLDNSVQAVATWIAANKIGAIWVPINTANKGEFLRHPLADCGAKLVVVDAQYFDRIEMVADGVPELSLVLINGEVTGAGNDSFDGDGAAYTNCSAGNSSFDGVGTSYINCTGLDYCFGETTLEGTYKNCTAGIGSFGFSSDSPVTIIGTFENCTAGSYSLGFAENNTATIGPATFTNCTAGNNSFGVGADGGFVAGIFTNCTAGINSFGLYGSAEGIFTNCTAGDTSFASSGSATGTFSNCVAGDSSFGAGGTLTGSLFYCRVINGGTYPLPTGAGIIRLCLDSDGDLINAQGI